MSPEDNSLETGYDPSASGGGTQISNPNPAPIPPTPKRFSLSHVRLNRLAIRITIFTILAVGLIGGGVLIYNKLHTQKSPYNSEATTGKYKIGSTLSVSQASQTQLLQLGQANELAINGQLNVSKSLVLTPSTAPSAPVTGQIYYDQTNNAPYYFNGSQFISLEPTAVPNHVTSLGGAAGVIGLGNGLTVNGNTLSVSSTLLQSISSSLVSSPVVDSLQGLTGNVTLTGGNGISISGTTITNSGVVSLTSSNNSVNVTNEGNGAYNLTLGGSGAVILGPSAAQTDNSNNPSLYINKTGTGDLVDLQSNGIDEFVVNQSGQITEGTINYSQVQGRPTSVVTDLSGESGSISVGSGLSISGNVLSNSGIVSLGGQTGAISLGSGLSLSGGTLANSGVTSVSGTPNQVSASAATGSITLSLPQDIDTTASPTFDNETLNGGLNVQGGLTIGLSGTDNANLYFANSANSNTVDFTAGNPTGTGSSTIELPSIAGGSSDTVCLQTLSNCSGTNAGSGDSSYIWNTTSLQPSSNFDISGNGVIGGTLSVTSTINGATISGGTLSGSTLSSTGLTFSASGDTITGPSGSNITVDTNGSATLNLGSSNASTINIGGSGSATNVGNTFNVSGLASLNGGTSTDSLDVSGGSTLQGATVVENTLQVQGGLTLGIPGTTGGNVYLSNTTSTNVVDLVGENPSGTGNATIQFPTIAAGDTDTVCLKNLGNCGATANTVTTSSAGTAGTIALFTGADTIANSSITDNGSAVTIGELLDASTIDASTIESDNNLTITPGGSLTIGSTSQDLLLQGNNTTTLSASAGGFTSDLEFSSPSANSVVTIPNATGTICLESSTSCGFALSGTGVTSLDTLSGALTINDSTGTGSVVTIQNASTSELGIAEFNSADFSVSSGVVSTVQGISTTSDVQFDSLALDYGSTCAAGGNLCIGNNATIYASNYTNQSSSGNLNISGGLNNVVFSNDNGANSFEFPTSGGSGQVICTSGITCASGGGQAVILQPSSEQSDTGSAVGVYINDNQTGGTADLVQLQTSGNNALVIDDNGNATFSNTTTAATLDVSGTLQASNITPSSALTVGSTSQSFTLQGNQSSEILGQSGSNSTYLGFGTPTGNTATSGTIYYNFDNSAAANTSSTPYFVCTTAGNCSGTGGSVTALSGSTADNIALFTSTSGSGGNLGSSIIGESGSNTINIGGDLNVGALGYSQLSVGVASSANGTIVVNNSSNSYNITINQAASPSSNVTLSLPTTSGTFAVSATGPLELDSTTGVLSCPSCDSSSGGGTAAVQSLNTLTGDITINNASTSGQDIQINYAKADGSTLGIATFNSTNFTDNGSGLINTAQNINTNANPVFQDLDLQGSTALTLGSTANDGKIVFLDGTTDSGGDYQMVINQTTLTANHAITIPNASGTLAVAATGNLTLSALGKLTITSSPTFSTSVTTPLLESTGSLSITPGGQLTAGSTSQQFVLQGTSASYVSVASGSYDTNIDFDTPTASNTIYVPAAGGTICLSSNNCDFAEGGGNYINNSTSQQTGANIDIQSIAGAVAASIQGASSQNILNLYSSASSSTPVAYFDQNGDLLVSTNDINGATITGGTISGGTLSGSTLSSTGLTFSGSSGTVTTGSGDSLTLDTGGGTSTLNLGNTNATTVNLGNSSAATSVNGSGVTIQAGSSNLALTTGTSTGNITLTTNNSSSSVIVKSSTNTPTAFEIQGSSSTILTADTTDDRIILNGGGYSGNVTTSQLYVGGQVPSEVAENTTDLDEPSSVYVQGNYAYIINTLNSELVIDNISKPSSPSVVKEITICSYANSIFVQGNYAYVACGGTNTLNIYNISDPANPTQVASTGSSTLSNPYSVYVQGNYAYVASNSNSKLVIYNISNPANPILTGSISIDLTGPTSVFVEGSYAYVATGTNTSNSYLVIYNISNPGSPSVASELATDLDNPDDVYVVGSYAYIVNNGNNELVIDNVSNPASQSVVSEISTDLTGPRSVFVQGRYAYVAAGNSSSNSYLVAFDISNPSSPAEIGYGSTDLNYPWSVFVQGRYAYVTTGTTTGNSALVDFDLGGSYIQQLHAGGLETGTLAVDDNASVSGDLGIQGGLTVGTNAEVDGILGVGTAIDSNTYNVGSTAVSGAINLYNGTSSGSYVFQGSSSQANATTITLPTDTNSTDTVCLQTLSNCSGTNAGSGDSSYIWNTTSLQPSSNFDISGNGVIGGTLSVTSTINSATISGGTLSGSTLSSTGLTFSGSGDTITGPSGGNITLDTGGGTSTLNLGNTNATTINLGHSTSATNINGSTATVQAANTVIKATGTSTTAFELQDSNSNAYLTGDSTDDRVVLNGGGYSGNATTAQLYVGGQVPAQVGSISTDLSSPGYVYVHGSYAYVVDEGSSNELVIYDISKASSPAVVTETSTDLSSPSGVYVQGNYAYVTSYGNSKLVIFNVSDPASPTVVAQVSIGATNPQYVYVAGSYAYVTAKNSFYIVNISSPANAYVVSSITTDLSNPQIPYVAGGYAYVPSYANSELVIFNVTNPASPSVAGTLTTDMSKPDSVYVQGNYAYVTNYTGGNLVVVNVTNPASPSAVGSSTASGLSVPWDVYVQGRYAYVVSGVSGGYVTTFDVSTPSSPVSVGDTASGSEPVGIAVAGRYAYVVDYTGNTMYDYDLGGAYIQQLSSGGLSTGSLSVSADADLGGDLGIQGGLTVGTNAEVDGILGVGTAIDSDTYNVGSTTASGSLAFYNGTASGSFTLQASGSQANATTLTIPADTNSTDNLCLQTLANCTGSNAGSGDSNYIWNTTSLQPSSNFDISGNGVIGGTLSVSGSTLSSTALTFNGAGDSITGPSGSNISLDTTGSATLNLGNTNATTINLGNTSSTTDVYGAGVSVQAGASNIALTSSSSIIAKALTDTSNAFEIQDSGGNSFFSANTNNDSVVVGTTSKSGILDLRNGTSSGMFSLEPSGSQSSTTTLTIPADTNSTDNLCLQTLANCTGSNAGSGDSNYIWNTTSLQPSSNFDISGNGVIGGTLSVTSTINGATISGSTNYDTVVGYEALQNNIGSYDSAVGYEAGNGNGCSSGSGCNLSDETLQGYQAGEYLQTSASDNTLIGYQAGQIVNTGADNTALGASALQATSSGGGNVAIGYNSLYANTTGADNTALGVDSLDSNYQGTDNVGLGYAALYHNASGSYNSVIGYQAGGYSCSTSCNVSGDTIQGYDAGTDIQSGANYSTLIGYESGEDITSGTNNIGLGAYSLQDTTTGGDNVALGYQALISNTSGGSNVALGDQALYRNTGGNTNVAVGGQSLYYNLTGVQNTALGYNALENTTSNYDTAIGVNALINNTSGSDNSALGYDAGYKDSGGQFSTLATLQNATAIGDYAQVQESNAIVLGSVDTATMVGIGTTEPTNTLSVSPVDLDSTTITASQSSSSATITASSSIFSASNVGETLIWADGTSETITGYTSGTVVTGSSTSESESGQYFRTQHPGFQVTSAGNAYVQNTSTTAFQVQNNSGTNLFQVDTSGDNVYLGATGSASYSSNIYIGTSSAAAQNVTVGSTNTSSTLTLQGGGGITANGYITQSESSGSSNGTISLIGQTATNANTSAVSTTVNGESITLIGTNNSNSGANTLNGLSLNNVTAATNNTFNGLYFGSGYNNDIDISSASGVTNFINTPTFILQSTGNITGAGTYDGATLSGGTLSGSTLSATGLTFSGSSDTITGPSGSNITLDTTGSATLNLGNTNATTVNLGNTSSTTNVYGSGVTLQAGSSNLALTTGTTTGNITFATNNASSSVVVKSGASTTTAFQIQDTNNNAYFSADSQNDRIDIGTEGTPLGQLYVSGSLPSSSYASLYSSDTQGFTVQGNYAYLTTGSSDAFQVVNISNPNYSSGLAIVGSYSPAGGYQYNAVAVSGSYAYVSVMNSSGSGVGFQVLNISNPSAPTAASSIIALAATDPIDSVVVSGDYLYLLDSSTSGGSSVVYVYNISNPNKPTSVSSIALANDDSQYLQMDSMAVANNYLFVTSAVANEVEAVNISSPADPGTPVVTSLPTNSFPTALAVSGDLLYVTDTYSSGATAYLQIFNISNPASALTQVTSSSTVAPIGAAGNCSFSNSDDVKVEGNYAYVVDCSSNDINVMNVANPATPQSVGTISTGSGSYPILIYVQGMYADVLINSTLAIYNIGGEYAQQLQSGGLETGTLEVDSNGTVGGDLSVQGGLSVGTNAEINGMLGVSNGAQIQGAVNITNNASTSFQVNGDSSDTTPVAIFNQGYANQPIAEFYSSGSQIVAEINANGSSGGLYLGSTGNFTGNLIFESSASSSGTVTLSSDVASSANSYTLYLPTTAPTTTGQCLADPSSTTQLGYVTCSTVSGSHSDNIVVPAEYAGAVLDASGDSSCSSADVGTMTSGNSDNSTNENYYQWTTSQSSSQCYDVVVQIPLPSDFGSFNGAPSIYDSSSSGSSVAVEPLTCSGSLDSNYSGYTTLSSTSSLSSEAFPSALGSSYTSCGYITLRFRLTAAASGGTAQIGTITIPYTSSSTNN